MLFLLEILALKEEKAERLLLKKKSENETSLLQRILTKGANANFQFCLMPSY